MGFKPKNLCLEWQAFLINCLKVNIEENMRLAEIPNKQALGQYLQNAKKNKE